jgi:hypothetical protein
MRMRLAGEAPAQTRIRIYGARCAALNIAAEP